MQLRDNKINYSIPDYYYRKCFQITGIEETETPNLDRVLEDENAKWLAWYMSGSGIILFILMCYVMIYSVIALMIHLSIDNTNKNDSKNKLRRK